MGSALHRRRFKAGQHGDDKGLNERGGEENNSPVCWFELGCPAVVQGACFAVDVYRSCGGSLHGELGHILYPGSLHAVG